MHSMFRFADWIDVVLMISGTVGAAGEGSSLVILFVITSDVMNTMGHGGRVEQNHDGFVHEVQKYSLDLVYIGLAVLVAAFAGGYCWSRTGERQVQRLRYKYLEAVLRQEVGFFDAQGATTSEVINSVSRDTSLIQDVLSEKVPEIVMQASVFLSAVAISTYLSWRLALVAFPLLLLQVVPNLIYGKYLLRISRMSREEYGQGSAFVQQALSSIKTIYSFTAEKRIVERYASALDGTLKLGIKQGLAKGLAVGSISSFYAIWALLAWYGSRLVMYNGLDGSRIYAAAVSLIVGSWSLNTVLSEVKHAAKALVAVTRIVKVIARTPEFDVDDPNSLTLDHFHGEIEFKSVWFTYPSRPDTVVLRDFSLRIPSGKTTALVGASGSGKSTIIALIQRFYDVDNGCATIDGVDVKKLQAKWMRSKMGFVSQDNALFGTSIKDNILFGKPDASMDEVYSAAMIANAHDFISQLPEGYNTKVGERGAHLSGGQKQRIAIARALVRNPAILLLDEATSALDSESEKLVQDAIDRASLGRTTVVVAHRLSTIRQAHAIAVIKDGEVMETGSHIDLINQQDSHYSQLVNLQTMSNSNDRRQDSCMHADASAADTYADHCTVPSAAYSPLSTPSSIKEKPSTIRRPSPSFTRLLAMNSPEWKQGLLGTLSAIVQGTGRPIYGFSIGGLTAAFYLRDHDKMQAVIRRYALILCSLSVVCILANILMHYCFAYTSEHLTKRTRLQVLEKMLTFEPAWFEEETNSSGALCHRLSNDASLLKTLVADRISLIVQAASGVVFAMLLGLIVTWKLALVMIALEPLMVLCFTAKRLAMSKLTAELLKVQIRGTQIASEAACNHRMITSFGCVDKVLELFEEAQTEPLHAAEKDAVVAGLTRGTSASLGFVLRALELWYGAKLVESHEASVGDVFKTFLMLVTTARVIADAGSMTSDLAKGASAVASVLQVLDRQSLIPNTYQERENADTHDKKRIHGKIEMVGVDFTYPSRPQSPVLRGFNLEVEAGSSVGLVGQTGCGKSTVIGLLQRFYDINGGVIRIDGFDLRQLNVMSYRRFTALVSQEPVIYSGSIRYNIAFGRPEASEEEVVEAAKTANAHDFICSLEQGYDTVCGERGVQLSGGQKQRIAIARAVIRNPAILLLDEATSALDVQSELVVQEALDRMIGGRTTVVVAHRLNTVRNLDAIAFLREGKVAENGSYQQLMSKKGSFFRLVNLHM